jgi:hypothetical protein
VIALAVYFCFADFVLISQCLYYNRLTAQQARRGSLATGANDANDPTQPLLSPTADNLGLPGSHRRSSASASQRRASSLRSPLPVLLEEESATSEFLSNAFAIIGVITVGVVGWVIAWQSGVWRPTPVQNQLVVSDTTTKSAVAAAFGYFSAVAYLGARIPQIVKNYRDKSCQGGLHTSGVD